MKITDAVIRRIKVKPKRFSVTDDAMPGLELQVTPAGTKTFYWRGMVDAKQQRVRLGRWPALMLGEASG